MQNCVDENSTSDLATLNSSMTAQTIYNAHTIIY